MARRYTTAELVRMLHRNADDVERLAAGLRRIHPERMTAQDWRDLRIDMLEWYQEMADQLRLLADVLDKRGARDESSYP